MSLDGLRKTIKELKKMPSNPFQPLKKEDAPKASVTDYNKDSDKYIITYGEVETVQILSDAESIDPKKVIENDFIVDKIVKEVDRVNRQEYLDSQSNDVGILNIIEKVRLSGDITLLNQTGRVPMAAVEKDALGHDLEPVVDVTKYQVDQVDALESYKVGASAYDSLEPELKKNKSLKLVAEMSDKEIDEFLASRIAANTKKVEESDGK